jgi:hypothetical protein
MNDPIIFVASWAFLELPAIGFHNVDFVSLGPTVWNPAGRGEPERTPRSLPRVRHLHLRAPIAKPLCKAVAPLIHRAEATALPVIIELVEAVWIPFGHVDENAVLAFHSPRHPMACREGARRPIRRPEVPSVIALIVGVRYRKRVEVVLEY